MSKSILVIDTPKNCKDCFCWDYDYSTCMASKELVEIELTEEKPDLCPLKELPEKISRPGPIEVEMDDWETGYRMGWNGCLRRITEETK